MPRPIAAWAYWLSITFSVLTVSCLVWIGFAYRRGDAELSMLTLFTGLAAQNLGTTVQWHHERRGRPAPVWHRGFTVIAIAALIATVVTFA